MQIYFQGDFLKIVKLSTNRISGANKESQCINKYGISMQLSSRFTLYVIIIIAILILIHAT